MRLRSIVSIAFLCVVATAAPALAEVKTTDVLGRWHNDQIWMLARGAEDCSGGKCSLTLDIVACGDSWCGIEVNENNTCGATALRFDAGKLTGMADGVLFSGKLELARGTEPYVVEAHMQPAGDGTPMQLSMTGDTGGEFRVFRRSFPFNATLARTGEATCKLEKPVS